MGYPSTPGVLKQSLRETGLPNPNCANYLSENLDLEAECILGQDGDLTIQYKGVRGRTSEVMLGVQRLNEETAGEENTKKLVDKIIVHRDGYLGGMYGEYDDHGVKSPTVSNFDIDVQRYSQYLDHHVLTTSALLAEHQML